MSASIILVEYVVVFFTQLKEHSVPESNIFVCILLLIHYHWSVTFSC